MFFIKCQIVTKINFSPFVFFQRFFPTFAPKLGLSLKTICTYVLLFALTLQSLHSSFLLAEYRVRLPEYLAKCINRDRPAMHCDGQCLLMQKVKEAEKGDSQKNLPAHAFSTLYVHQERLIFVPHIYVQSGEKPFSPYRMGRGTDHHAAVFHPPIA